MSFPAWFTTGETIRAPRRYQPTLALLVFALLLSACTSPAEPAVPAAREMGVSAEAAGPAYWKGIGFSEPFSDERARSNVLDDLGASWWHSWGYEDAFLQDPRFVPMISAFLGSQYAGGICTAPSCLANYARNYPGRTWLLLDEPERPGQNAISPEAAASKVDALVGAMRAADSTAKFACCGTWTDGQGTQWMHSFLGAVAARIDVIHVHAYYPGHAQGRAESLEGFYREMQTLTKGRGLPIWITEVGYQCTEGSSEWVRDWLAAPFFEWYRCGGGSAMFERVAWKTTNRSAEQWYPTHLYADDWTRTPLGYYYRFLGQVPPAPPAPPGSPIGEKLIFKPVADAYLNTWYSTRNYGLESEIVIRNPDVKAGLLRFDVSSLVNPQAITHARILLFTSRPGVNSITLAAHRVLRPWVEAETTWYLAANGQPWGLPGANAQGSDRLLNMEDSVALRPDESAWYQLDLSGLVRAWATAPDSNLGVALKASGDLAGEFAFASREHADACWQAKLEVWYDTSLAEPTKTTTLTQTPTSRPSNTPTIPPFLTSTPTHTGTVSPVATPTNSLAPSRTPTLALPPTRTTTPPATLSELETRLQSMENKVPAISTRVAGVAGVLKGFVGVNWLGPGNAPSDPRRLTAYRLAQPPAIDGDLGEWSSDGLINFNKGSADYQWGAPVLFIDPRAYVTVRWDDKALYFAIRVRDPDIVTDSGIRIWQDDGIEIAIDGAYDRRYSPLAAPKDDLSLAMRPDGTLRNYDKQSPPLEWAVGFTAAGYDMELRIPFSSLTTRAIVDGARMGITFGLRDDDDGGALDSYLVWEGNDPSVGQGFFGELFFSGQIASLSDLGMDTVPGSRAITGAVILQQGTNGYAGVEDTYLFEGECSEIAYYGEKDMAIGMWPGMRALLRFDLTRALPENAIITQALLGVHAYSGGWSPLQIDAHRVNAAWRSQEATWSLATYATPWRSPGCSAVPIDRAEQVAASTTASSLNAWYSFDLTTMARDWLANPGTNFGVILVPVPGPAARYRFYSSESPQVGWRPRLIVNYRVP